MTYIKSVVVSMLVLAGASQAQNILGQYSVPFNLARPYPPPPMDYPMPPYVALSQMYTPDGSGGLFLFNLPDNSLHRFDSSGNQLWNVSFGFGSLRGAIEEMAVASDGVYLAGQANGALPGQTNSGAFVVKYDLNGKTLWTTQFGTPNGVFASAIALAPDGVYILGVPAPSNCQGLSCAGDLFICKADANGNEIWTRQSTDPTFMDIIAAADSTGVYFSSMGPVSNIVRKFDPAGNDLWTHQLENGSSISGIAPDGQGGAYVAFETGLGFGSPSLSVRDVDSTGAERWTRGEVSSCCSGPIAADATGFYLSGVANTALPGQCYAGQGDVFLMRFDRAGNPLWTREFGTGGPDSPAQISIGASEVDVSAFLNTSQSVYVTRIEKSSAPITDSTPRILMECVLNSANYLGGGVAPGEIVTILGSSMGPPDVAKLQTTPDGHIPTSIAGAQILFNGEPAPLIYVSAQQSSAIVPYDVAGKSTVDVQVAYNGVQSSAVTVPVFDSRPGVYSYGLNGTGQAAVINEDGTVNSPFNPAAPGSVVSIYATGGGLPQPPGADDQITGDNLSPFKGSAYIRLESYGCCCEPFFPANVLYYGGAPQSVPGFLQITAQLPPDVPPGDAVPLYFGLDPNSSIEQMVTIAVQ